MVGFRGCVGGVDGSFESGACAVSAWKAKPRWRVLKDWGYFGSTTALSELAWNCCPADGALGERGAVFLVQPLAATDEMITTKGMKGTK